MTAVETGPPCPSDIKNPKKAPGESIKSRTPGEAEPPFIKSQFHPTHSSTTQMISALASRSRLDCSAPFLMAPPIMGDHASFFLAPAGSIKGDVKRKHNPSVRVEGVFLDIQPLGCGWPGIFAERFR